MSEECSQILVFTSGSYSECLLAMSKIVAANQTQDIILDNMPPAKQDHIWAVVDGKLSKFTFMSVRRQNIAETNLPPDIQEKINELISKSKSEIAVILVSAIAVVLKDITEARSGITFVPVDLSKIISATASSEILLHTRNKDLN